MKKILFITGIISLLTFLITFVIIATSREKNIEQKLINNKKRNKQLKDSFNLILERKIIEKDSINRHLSNIKKKNDSLKMINKKFLLNSTIQINKNAFIDTESYVLVFNNINDNISVKDTLYKGDKIFVIQQLSAYKSYKIKYNKSKFGFVNDKYVSFDYIAKDIIKYSSRNNNSYNINPNLISSLPKMNKFIFNYYVISTNNLDFKNNNNYLDKYIKYYKKIMPKSEFQLKTIREKTIIELQDSISKFKYSKHYKKNISTRISKYNFSSESFNLNISPVLYQYGYYNILQEFNEIGFGNGTFYGYFNLFALNYLEFNKINLNPIEAEKLVNSLNNRYVYLTIEYSLLKNSVIEADKIGSMLGFIEHIYFFSDSDRKNLVLVLNNASSKENYINYKYSKIIDNSFSSNISFHLYN